MTDVLALVQDLCVALEADYSKNGACAAWNSRKYVVETGRKYLKVIMVETATGGRSVHAFVDKSNGLLFKAASWNAPAKGARYDLKQGTPAVDWAGGYLYRQGEKCCFIATNYLFY